jgi:hypothetical protein
VIDRRGFIKGGLIATAVVVFPIAAVSESRQLWTPVAEALKNRRQRKPSRYREIHRCAKCGQDFYCPDRWMAERCEVKAYCEQRGWRTDAETCLPCKFGADTNRTEAANMAAWWEAHRV